MAFSAYLSNLEHAIRQREWRTAIEQIAAIAAFGCGCLNMILGTNKVSRVLDHRDGTVSAWTAGAADWSI